MKIALLAALALYPVASHADDFSGITNQMIVSMQKCTFVDAISGIELLHQYRTDGVDVTGPIARHCADETGFLSSCSAHYPEDACAIVATKFAEDGIAKADRYYAVGGK